MMGGITPHLMPSLLPPIAAPGAGLTPDGRALQRLEDAARKRTDKIRNGIEGAVGADKSNNRQGASLLAVPDWQDAGYELQRGTRSKTPRLLGE